MNRLKFLCLSLLLLSGISQAQISDIGLLEKIHVHRNTNLDPTMRVFTESVLPANILVPVGLYAYGYHKNDSLMKRKALVTAGSILLSGGTSYIIKVMVRRERPYVNHASIVPQTHSGPLSFPSGHTSQSFAMATALTLQFPRWYVAAPSYLWAGTVAYSRMHLGVHYPTDILAGAIIGTGSAFLCHKANQWLRKERRK